MWAVDALELRRFQGRGEPFTELVDALICSEMSIAGIPDSALSTNLRVTITDGGVDTRLDVEMSTSRTGWFGGPTCWQYKAQACAKITDTKLKKEISKKHASDLIKKGYAYRLCVADSMPDEKKQAWEDLLLAEAQKIEPSAKKPLVITADRLSQWISRRPALVARFFKGGLLGFMDLTTWKPNALALTPTYLPVSEWSNVKNLLTEHVDLSRSVPDPVLRLQGEAGVGKTRFVYETLSGIRTTRQLTLYTLDYEHALTIAPILATNHESAAILVVDDCPLECSVKLSDLLRGYKDTVRVVVIDNAGTEDTGLAPELRLEQIPPATVNEILIKNFPGVPFERRLLYGELSGGFIRLAADLCQRDAQNAQAGDVKGTLPSVRVYLQTRLSSEDYRALQALSLVLKVGFRDELDHEIDELCTLLNLDKVDLVNRAKRLKDAPGFITQGGRYFYVTPEIVAQVAFQDAWKFWIEDNSKAFFAKVPQSLLQSFHQRVMKSAADEHAREAVADFFRGWAEKLKASDLAHHKNIDRLLALGETRPDTYLPLISGLISNSSRDELLNIDTARSDDEPWRWGPRRYLVWFFERIASFPEYFDEAQHALFQLALAETEHDISNNATGVWRDLFCIFAGTATPYLHRLSILRTYMLSPGRQVTELEAAALEAALRSFDGGTRTLGPRTFAGRLIPIAWHPSTTLEASECYDNTVDLIQQLAVSGNTKLEDKARNIAYRNLRSLLYRRKVDSLKVIFCSDRTPVSTLPLVLEQIDNFLKYDQRRQDGSRGIPKEYIAEVLAWRDKLMPADHHGRLVSLIGQSPWHERNEQEKSQWQRKLTDVAKYLHEDPDLFKAEISWLSSPGAKSAVQLGVELGRLDHDARDLAIIAKTASDASNYALARGYIAGLLQRYPAAITSLNDLLDAMEAGSPEAVYELSMVGGRKARALERALRLVDAQKIPAFRLEAFSTGLDGELSDAELEEIFARFLKAIKVGDHQAAKAAVSMLGYLVRSEPPNLPAHVKSDQAIGLAWKIIEQTTNDEWAEPYWWSRALEALSKRDGNRAAKIASLGLTGSFFISQESEKVLIRIAAFAPKAVMLALGERMLDEKLGLHFFLGVHRALIAALPADVVQQWLEDVGVEGARRIARHLPEPFIDSNDVPTVPALTGFVLTNFEEDDRTFQEFYAGMHSHKSYVGNIASQVENEGLIARRFLNSPIPRIKEWARLEVQGSAKEAEMWRRLEEEQKLR